MLIIILLTHTIKGENGNKNNINGNGNKNNTINNCHIYIDIIRKNFF